MLVDLYKHIPRDHAGEPTISIAHAAVTGYGEHYLSRAFSFDSSEVETVCHVRRRKNSFPTPTSSPDIGGQDIKCVYLEDGLPQDIVLNEACSSGCGALLSGMAWSMNVRFDRFLESALYAENPVDLGTRCTVFMTSRVRHAQKEGLAWATSRRVWPIQSCAMPSTRSFVRVTSKRWGIPWSCRAGRFATTPSCARSRTRAEGR